MSRADWSFLEHLLEEGQEYSTGIGRIWLTVLFLFRILVLGTAAESAWDDEQADFVCNTKQPGCTSVCYDKAFPISHFRYFVLQVIFVSTPTIFYFGYVAIRARREKAKEDEKVEEGSESSSQNVTVVNDKNVTGNNAQEQEKREDRKKCRKAVEAPHHAPKLKGRLLCAYAFCILVKIVFEAGSIVGLWILYDGFFIAPKFECTRSPCPHTVDCFVSRPTEKTIFTFYTQAMAAVSLILNFAELLHLIQLAISHKLEKVYRSGHQAYLPPSEQVQAGGQTPEALAHNNIQLQHESTSRYSNPCESYGDLQIEVNWEAGSDVLPSYLRCMEAAGTAHHPRTHCKKQAHHPYKNTKGAYKGQSKQKHYV
ncbi:gap junction alpha-4 protein [Cynoglossus semilaevis]|uniref:Gap junction protein n=1 Tax=Cynoglossus semilaevis TaxID=244447 RepID=A0A3P8WAD5_CYNSE|nr:gap junction alpha-4 protein [Cynoglossus semilaevis]